MLQDPRLLTSACAAGSVRIARLLIERGANVGCTKRHEDLPLHTACKTGNVALVQLICEAGRRSELAQSVSWLAALRNLITTNPFTARQTIVGSQSNSWVAFVWSLFATMFSRKVDSLAFIDAKDQSAFSESALHVAVQQNQTEVVRFLIGQGAELRSGGMRGEMPLHLAAWRGNVDVVTAILDCVDEEKRLELLNAVDNFGNTPVHHAAETLSTLRLLVAAGGDLARLDAAGRTVLMIAAEKRAMDVVAFVVGEFSVDVALKAEYINARSKSGETAIHVAAKAGTKKIVAFLIAQGADFRAAGNAGCTPLHYAAENGETAVVRLLLDSVSERERVDYVNAVSDSCNGKTALVSAIRSSSLEIIDVLVKAGADVTFQDSEGRTALMFAARIGFRDVVDYILQTFDNSSKPAAKSVYVNLTNKSDGTALHLAVKNNRAEVVESLISNGADVRIGAAWLKRMALHVAVEEGRMDLVRSLLAAVTETERAAYVDIADSEGDTSLHLAVLKSSECVALLVEAGAKLTARNRNGKTPLTLAASVDKHAVVVLLLDAFRADAEGVTKVEYIEMRGANGKSALDVAREREDRRLVATIEETLRREGFEPRQRRSRCVLS